MNTRTVLGLLFSTKCVYRICSSRLVLSRQTSGAASSQAPRTTVLFRTPASTMHGHLAHIKKMKIVHACGPYGNDCGGEVALPSRRSAALKTLPAYHHYTSALEDMANSV
eukprot:3610923-Rhodomonas_salina.1